MLGCNRWPVVGMGLASPVVYVGLNIRYGGTIVGAICVWLKKIWLGISPGHLTRRQAGWRAGVRNPARAQCGLRVAAISAIPRSGSAVLDTDQAPCVRPRAIGEVCARCKTNCNGRSLRSTSVVRALAPAVWMWNPSSTAGRMRRYADGCVNSDLSIPFSKR